MGRFIGVNLKLENQPKPGLKDNLVVDADGVLPSQFQASLH